MVELWVSTHIDFEGPEGCTMGHLRRDWAFSAREGAQASERCGDRESSAVTVATMED
jgi:hypothetical protein